MGSKYVLAVTILLELEESKKKSICWNKLMTVDREETFLSLLTSTLVKDRTDDVDMEDWQWAVEAQPQTRVRVRLADNQQVRLSQPTFSLGTFEC